MRRRRLLGWWSLAGLPLLVGCADSASPPQAKRDAPARQLRAEDVVRASHFEPVPAVDADINEPPVACNVPLPAPGIATRRLPPVYPVTYPVTEAATIKTPAAGASHRLERLPELSCVSTTSSQPYAIDLSEPDESSGTTSAEPNAKTNEASVLMKKPADEPGTAPDAVVPARRVLEPKPPKPALPPLASPSVAAPNGSVGWLMTQGALAAVSQRADAMIDRGFLLAEKGAYYSAQSELKQSLRTVAQALDTHFGGTHYSKALAAGWLAIEEADDFSSHSQRGPVVDVALIVDSHQTTLLKGYALDDVSPVLAMQHYFSFAQEQLVEASGRAPVASRALHGLGKIHMVLGEKSSSAERLHGPKAMVFQQAALTTDPSNHLAANELGVLLARFGKLQEARAVLQHSVALNPLPVAWQNLSVVHQRLGENMLAAQSHANWQLAIQQSSGSAATQHANRSMVQWVSPQAFAGAPPGGTDVPPLPPTVATPVPPVQAQRKSGFLWW